MKKNINCKGKLLDLSNPIVMGILNITPDSFYDGNKYKSENEIAKRAEQILSEGGKIIDVGAYSSRPGTKIISEKEELNRLIFALEIINKKNPDAIISVDTFRARIAKIVVKNYNVSIINDISAGQFDPDMFCTMGHLNVPYIIMHTKGNPQNMQNNPQYSNVIKEIALYFSDKILKASIFGINDLIIDPGFGFGKTIEHNYTILNELDKFKMFERPILVGMSRKSMIYHPLNITPEEALPGTIALNAIALQKGANILRVHDVREAVQNIQINSLLNT